ARRASQLCPTRRASDLDPGQELPARAAAVALVEAAGGTVAEFPGGDVGRSGESVAAVRAAARDDPARGVLALGGSFGPADAWQGDRKSTRLNSSHVSIS